MNLKRSLELAEKAEPKRWEAITEVLRGQPSPFYRPIIGLLCRPEGYVAVVAARGESVPASLEQQSANAQHIAWNDPKRVKEMATALREARKIMRAFPCIGCRESLGNDHFTTCPKSWLARYGEDRDE